MWEPLLVPCLREQKINMTSSKKVMISVLHWSKVQYVLLFHDNLSSMKSWLLYLEMLFCDPISLLSVQIKIKEKDNKIC